MSDPTTMSAPEAAADAARPFANLFEQTLAHAKDTHERMSEMVRNSTDAFGEALTCANRGSAEYRAKVLEIARANTNAVFDAALEAMAVRSASDLVELSSTLTRRQLGLAAAQMQELAALTQKVVSETTAPIHTGITEPFRQAS